MISSRPFGKAKFIAFVYWAVGPFTATVYSNSLPVKITPTPGKLDSMSLLKVAISAEDTFLLNDVDTESCVRFCVWFGGVNRGVVKSPNVKPSVREK